MSFEPYSAGDNFLIDGQKLQAQQLAFGFD